MADYEANDKTSEFLEDAPEFKRRKNSVADQIRQNMLDIQRDVQVGLEIFEDVQTVD